MLLYLNYERNRKQWNYRFFILFGVCCIAWGFIGFKTSPATSDLLFVSEEDLPDVPSGQLTLLTYNIAGLPEWISSASTPRSSSIEEIGRKVNAFDIVNVQEDFNYNKFLYSFNLHPYRTVNKGGVPLGDGLSTLSKYPIVDFERVAWSHCSGADCLARKGFTYARIGLAKGVFIDVYNVHATAQNNKYAVRARQENLNQLARFIKEMSPCEALILMGDFNAHYAYSKDSIKEFQEELSVFDTWVVLQNGGAFPECRNSFEPLHKLMLTDKSESIDKVYFRNSDKIIFNPKNYRIEKAFFRDKDGQPLSDHLAVSLDMEWKIVQ